ncbi:MAG TPA: BamA/TamA family outer membrane protein [Longimicrobiaceae bacterium]|nr:BamA/TamA family outer membrane protein [Longimicrobiaceae bacterium]
MIVLLCFLALAFVAPRPLAAQADSVTVVAGPQYGAAPWQEALLGTHYRELWTAPIRVPVLDLQHFAGGLTPVEIGGGLQTITLHLDGADGREYVFRSVDKDPKMADEPSLRGTVIAALVRDQTSSLNPGGALAVPTILDAVGVPHPTPGLYVMPDDPALGEFREQFAGMLGTLVVKPNEQEGDHPGFGGFSKITGTDKLLERLEDDSDDRADARAYLKARLVDMVIGDWDRNPDNWRWAEVDSGSVHHWVAIPRDRDYAFVDYDGLLMKIGRNFVPNAVHFTPRIKNVYGLTLNARALDRRLLASLDRAAWDSVAAFVRSRITDAVIDSAVAHLPAAYREIGGAELARRLKSRRNSLPDAAREYYRLLSTDVDVDATDKRDVAFVDRLPDGSVDVRIYDADREGRPKPRPYFHRLFPRSETREVRLKMHGGDDRVTVRGGTGPGVTVRVVGGGGDDVLADSSRAGRTAFYDDRGSNRFIRGAATSISTRPYDPPDTTRSVSGETYRDWGSRTTIFPAVGWHGPDGLLVGAALTSTRFGFRRPPYAHSVTVRAMIGLATGAVGAEVKGDVHLQNSDAGYSYRLLATQLESMHFYGLGNETEAGRSSDFYVVRQDRFEADALYRFDLPGPPTLEVGPVVKFMHSQLPPGTPFALEQRYGRDFGQAGALTELTLDTRDHRLFPDHGALVGIGGSAYPGIWSAKGAFGEAHARASAYLTLPLSLRPMLALRAGGQRVWGDYPLHEAAFLGGSTSLRGYPTQRFAGDAMLFGNAELRVPVDTVKLLVRGELGVLGLVDAGRVYLSGEDSDAWHRAAGGGLWFRFAIRGNPLSASVTYAYGDAGRVYFKLGAPF